MAGDSANAVLSVIAEKVITPVVDAIGRQFGYLFFYKSNIKNLEKKVTQLEKSRDDVDSFFKAQSQNNEEITESGAGWLKGVEEATMAAKEVLEAKDKLKGWCLNLKNRYVLSRKSTKLVAEIQELHDQAPKRGATNPPHPAGMLPGSSSNVASKDFKTRAKIMDNVMEALTNDRINIIGICGLGGIGKTTILHEVRERARTQKLFDEVAMTTVSQDINMSKIQTELAGMLGLTSIKDVDNIIARADLLHKRLTNGNRILVVLDDVWSEIKLKEVGIPVGNDRAKCKVVLASRNKDVCTIMGTQKTISVDVLSEEEAWDMFKKTAGECVQREKLEEIAKEVADKCGGLPIALLTLAKALSNKRREAWEDARRQLRQYCAISIVGISKEVYLSLKLSYDFLEKELPEAQPLLLICCQHPEDAEIEVEKLTRYCLALELFKNVDKVEDARNRTYAVIEHLRSCFLLQAVDVDEEEKDMKCETVKMHDVVREVCLSTVSEVKDNVSMHIMVQDTDGGYDLGTSKVDYSKLKLLMNAPLDSNLLDISFLQRMEELRVFESISKKEFYQPSEEEYDQPPPLQVLANLRMLSLEGKSLSEEMTSTIGSQSRLEILSFWKSRISLFPSQIRQLRNLKLLDLRCSKGEGLIPSGILPGLNKLEVLYMGNFILLGAAHNDNQKNHNGEKSHGSITELDSLSNLTTLQILVDPRDLQDLQRFSFDKLKSFFFGLFRESNEYYSFKRYRWCPVVQKTIKWGNLVGTKWVSGANIQFIAMSTLDLQLNNIDDWIDPLIILEKFVSLKELKLIRCKQLEYIIPEGSLTELRFLRLEYMPVMRHLWAGPTNPPCLVNLREVEIANCPAIKSVFPHSAAKCLVQLQTLAVGDCLMLEGIVSKGESGTTTTSRGAEIRKEPPNDFTIQFPKLERLILWNLPKLGVFYNFELDDGSVQQSLFNPLVMLPSLKELLCRSMHQLKQIVGGGMLIAASDDDNWLQNLEKVDVKWCDSLETVFDFERLHLHSINGMGENADHALTLLGGLKSVHLHGLPKLEHLCRQIPQGIHAFQNLISLEVENCDSLGYLISSSMAHMLVNLQTLRVEECKSMKEVIKMINNEDCGGVKKIVFPSLREVALERLENLSSFYSGDQQESFINPLVMLPSLKELDCSGMHQLKQIVGGGMLIAASDDDNWLQNLEEVDVRWCDSLETVFDFERLHLHSINGMGENADHVLTLLGGLKSVELSFLPKLEHLCRQIPQGIHAFQNLISLEVENCDSLGYLISSSMAHMLVNLQTLRVEECKSMKEVIKMINNGDCGGVKKIVFPSLRVVALEGLENLSSFYSGDQQESFINPLVMLPSLKELDCSGMHQLKQIVGGGMLIGASDDDNWLQNLEKVDVQWCDSLETVFDFERLHLHSINGMRENADHVLTLLGGLKSVYLRGLPKLEHLCRQIPQGIHAFQNLIKLDVNECDSLGYLISSSMAHMLVNLQSLNVERCESMKEVIKMINNEDCGGVKKIVFPSLREVTLHRLENLSSFYSGDQQEFFINPLVMLPSLQKLYCDGMHQLKQIVGGGMLIAASDDDWLQNLEKVNVEECDSLETVFDFERLHLHSINGMGENADHVLTLLGGLKSVKLSLLPKLEHLCRQIPQGIHAFQNLISLKVDNCDSLGYLISSSMAHMLVNLQSLNVVGCESMKEVIKINEDCSMKEIVFHSLSEVILKDLEKLSSFCSSDQQAFEFPSLGKVVIVNCLEMNTFCCGHVTAEKLHGVKPSDRADDDELVWKGDLNETVRHLNERNRVNQMNSDMEEDDVPGEGIVPKGQGTPMKALMPLSVASSPNASLTPDVVSHSPPVSDNNNEELANSSSPDLGSVTLPPLIEFVPSASMEQSLQSSDSPVQPKTDKELSNMSFSSRDDDWKRSRILIQGVYVEAKLKTTFEEILTAKPNFLSGLRLKLAKMKTDVIESAIRSLQILRQSNALTISLEELTFIKDSLDDLETSGLDTAWLEKGYQRAILVMKEQKVVSAAAELVTLEREKTEDAAAFELARAAFELARDAFEMARAKLEASTARRDAFKAEFGALMQEELAAGKELFAGGFDLETSLGDGLLD